MENNKTSAKINLKRRKRRRKLIKRKKRIDKIKRILFTPSEWNLKKVLMTLGIIYVAYSLIYQQVIITNLKSERIETQQDIKTLKSEIKDLSNKIENKTDIVYIERIARDDLNMLRPDELMYGDVDRDLKDENEKK